MLKSIDILIGFSLIMLLCSMAVTVFTQVFTTLRNWRGRHLLEGLTSLLNQVAPGLTRDYAEKIATAVLTHPLIALPNGKLGGVIEREELTRILLELAGNEDTATSPLDSNVRAALRQTVHDLGIPNSSVALEKIHMLGLKIEALRPDMTASVRQNLAVVTEASSAFVARIHAWFDETMDRVSQKFNLHARIVTVAGAILVAATLQLDSLDLLKRLSMDDQLRSALTTQAAAVEKTSGGVQEAVQLRDVARTGYALWPSPWLTAWNWPKIPGVLLSAMLLSLGAPFWYNALKDLVRLRPILASKEEEQRQQRQLPAAACVPLTLAERGDPAPASDKAA